MEWWTRNKDAIIAIVAVLGVMGSIAITIWAAIKWGFLRRWQRRLRVDVKVFEVISDPAVLLSKLYATENDNSPLADHNIKYQPRDPNRDLQAELKTALNRSRYLLITAPTGYGKTREAGVLAQAMMLEGWRVLRIENTGWLDIPKTLPKALNNNRSRILIFLDDLNGLFSIGERTESPRAERIPMLSEPSYHDRLLQVLDMLEGMCTEKEIRVIATARSEADQWNILNFNSSDRLWRRFERIELSEPNDSSIVNLLADSTKQVDLKANHNDFAAIAHKSDGTYRNIVLNLRRWHIQNKEVSKDDFTETLDGSWRDIYEGAIKKHPAVKHVYDAIDILRQARVDLMPTLVESVSIATSRGNPFQKIMRRLQIRIALDYLTKETKFLRKTEGQFTPSDGQIEAKDTKLDWSEFILDIEKSILDLEKIRISEIHLLVSNLLSKLAYRCFEIGKTEDAIRILPKATTVNEWYWDIVSSEIFASKKSSEDIIRKAIKQSPQSHILHYVLGLVLQESNHQLEAESSYRTAISLNSDFLFAHTKLGDLLRKLERFKESEDIYRQMIAKNPHYAYAYFRLGSLLREMERFDEAEKAYKLAFSKNLDDFYAFHVLERLGDVLEKLGRYAEAEESYRQSINKNFTGVYVAYTYFYLGNVLRKMERYNEAQVVYEKAIELDSSNPNFYKKLVRLLRVEASNRREKAIPFLENLIEINPEDFDSYLAVCSIEKEMGKSISITYVEKARQLISDDDWYNRACLESICDNFDLAFEHLQKATQLDKFNLTWAWKDPDLEWIRDDPRFAEIVGPKPEEKNSEV